jgi:hypothetical protein
MHTKSLSIRTRMYGDSHLSMAAPFDNAGEVYRSLGQYSKRCSAIRKT